VLARYQLLVLFCQKYVFRFYSAQYGMMLIMIMMTKRGDDDNNDDNDGGGDDDIDNDDVYDVRHLQARV